MDHACISDPSPLRRCRRRGGSGQPPQDRLGKGGRNREADAGGPTLTGEHDRVDADRLAPPVDQRAAAVARIDARVGLYEAPVRLRLDRAVEGTDDADGGGLIEYEGVADGHDGLADLQ